MLRHADTLHDADESLNKDIASSQAGDVFVQGPATDPETPASAATGEAV